MDEVTKYTRLWDLPQGYGNNWDHPYWKEIGSFIVDAMAQRGLWVDDDVLDIGGGNGKFEPFLGLEGGTYTTLDIAPNSGADIIGNIADDELMHDVRNRNQFEWVVAIDMLEHLPTDHVEPALSNIRSVADHGFIALISTRPDRGGKKIGAKLHMTVQPSAWWVGMLAKEFDAVQVLREVPGEYCIVVAM